MMASYNDPDEFYDQSQIPWGTKDWNGPDKESIRRNLWSTNRAAYWAYFALTDPTNEGHKTLRQAIAEAIWHDTSVAYENQVDEKGNPLPIGEGARDTMARSFQATNGQVYRNSATLTSIVARLDAQDKLLAAIAAKVGVTPGN
jgi:hypothetical protein